jgi:hypothetical protein
MSDKGKNKLSKIPYIDSSMNRKSDYPFTLTPPLKTHGAYLFVGKPGSGKTSLVTSMLLSENPVYYRQFFDNVYIVSQSLETLPLDKFDLEPSHIYDGYSESNLTEILENLKEGDNGNDLIWFDDCVDNLKLKDSLLPKLMRNRRHITQNDKDNIRAELSVWISTQKYNLFPLSYRTAISNYFIWPVSNASELKAIREELMGGLTTEEQDAILDHCWSEPYSFMMVDAYSPTLDGRFYKKFDKIKIK